MKATTLQDLSWSDWQPFALQLDDCSLQLQQCLRLLPGKRMACRAQCNEAPVFAKLFFGPGHRQQRDAERDNLKRLAAAGVRCPELLACPSDEAVSVLVLEWLPQARTLGEIPLRHWDEPLSTRFCQQLRSLFDGGLLQSDLHLDNFLYADGELYVIDAGDVRVLSAPASPAQRTDNLGLLCAQAPLPEQHVICHLIEQQLADCLVSAQALRARCHHYLIRRTAHAQRKWLRASTAIDLVRAGSATVYLERAMPDALRQQVLDILLQPQQLAPIKKGSRIHVFGDASLVAKQYCERSLKSRLKQRLSMHPAQRSWRAGWTWSLLGLRTPRPHGLLLAADGSAVLVAPRQPGERFSELLEYQRGQANQLRGQVEQMLGHLGDAQCWHGDAKAQNILVDDGVAHWIDLDAAGFSGWRYRAAQRHHRDVQRFAANWDQFVERSAATDDASHGEKP